MPDSINVDLLDDSYVPEVARVLCDSFYDYPVMRFVLGSSGQYDVRLETLVNLFVMSRVHRGEWMLGARDNSGLKGVAVVSNPGNRIAPENLVALRERTWRLLGPGAKERYDAFSSAASTFDPGAPHIHLNMIGVLRSRQGSGVGKRLLHAVHEHSRSIEWSEGVSLSTEAESNVALYAHFGYEVIGSADVKDAFTTWAMYRKNE